MSVYFGHIERSNTAIDLCKSETKLNRGLVMSWKKRKAVSIVTLEQSSVKQSPGKNNNNKSPKGSLKRTEGMKMWCLFHTNDDVGL